jgi:hypothetical protein
LAKIGQRGRRLEFAPIERSYAAQTGRPENVGVIGMAAFRERQPPSSYVAPPPSPPIAARAERHGADAAGAGGQAAAPSPANEKGAAADAAGARLGSLGTGHGQREWSVSRRTAFERATSASDQVTQLEYDSFERLVAAGVVRDPYAYVRPRPFPANQAGFVPDPPLR